MLSFIGILFVALINIFDTIPTRSHTIDEVVVVSYEGVGKKRSTKGEVASIDEHLSVLSGVNLVRRGGYAWEPVVNNMQTERVSTTIDGMKIFYACTDKMDPVTSYVESGNLQSISLNSGLDGNPQASGNIGGSIDLKLRKVGFWINENYNENENHNKNNGRWEGNASIGYEHNGNVQVYGADAAYSSPRFYTNFGSFYRHADSYKAGGGEKVDFSQFSKVNAFGNIGVKATERDIVEGTFIYDRAYDVGYPALNMDVKKAEAFITSVAYRHLFSGTFFDAWETKAYYNHITHTMDDTKRPNVEIHMDMPGKSWTSGLYSILTASGKGHSASLNYDLYYNRVFADMTMYPGGAAPMYMVTWPDVGTLNTGVALSDNISLPHDQAVRMSAKLSWQTQRLNSEEGRNALRVFFPRLQNEYNQTIGRVAASYAWSPQLWQFSVGTGWGSRAATVTEAYGYYLNNTFDQYDYIGNPHLKNESAVELNAAVKWNEHGTLSFRADANAFLLSNYIIGQFENRLSPMTVDAEGVKVYGNLSHATIFNTSFCTHWQFVKRWSTDAQLSYAIGKDNSGDALPLVSPLAYSWTVAYNGGSRGVSAQAVVKGNARQVRYGAKYGETSTPAYAIVNASVQYGFDAFGTSMTLRGGVENLFDRHYSSYSDWNAIPQKGRNVYINVNITL